MVFNVEIITWLHTCLMVEPYPKTAQVFETRQKPSRCSGDVDEMFLMCRESAFLFSFCSCSNSDSVV